jgi:hypothetical protein
VTIDPKSTADAGEWSNVQAVGDGTDTGFRAGQVLPCLSALDGGRVIARARAHRHARRGRPIRQ